MADTIHSEDREKLNRTLAIYTKLMDGYAVNKEEEARRYNRSTRSIQRDIDDIRLFLASNIPQTGIENNIVYDRVLKAFRLEHIYQMKFSNAEILVICKILLDSRALTKTEMLSMTDRLIECCVPESNRKLVKDLIRNESFHYIQPRHGNIFIDRMWELAQAIHESRFIEIRYQGIQGSTVKTRKLKPLAIMFSEYYFYLAAFIDDEKVRENFNVINDGFPTIYRIDRIQGLKVLEERYHIPYKDRFEEGEFRKRIQFMFGGKLRRIRFRYSGYSVEAVLDRLPMAVIEKEEPHEDGKRTVYTISAEVFGDGIDMWIRSQGGDVELII